jgi:hypothetical protein
VGLAGAAELTTNATLAEANPWEVAFGSALMSDFNIRGISASARRPSVNAYFEPRYKISPNLEFYSGISGSSIDSPNRSTTQMVFYGGLRPVLGPASFDFGLSYLDFPGGLTFPGMGSATTCTNGAFFFGQCNTSKGNLNFWEANAKTTLTLSDALAFGANLYYSPSWLNSGAYGTFASLTTKITLPSATLPTGFGAYISSELGHYWYGTTDAFYGVPAFPAGVTLPGYTTWNVGISFTYKVATLDLRYYDTDLSRANCNVLTADYTAAFGGPGAVTAINPSGLVSNWCGAAFIAKLSFDLTLANLK